ncbi:hypothetical protein [Actinoplanes sp. NPDC051494]|uniref:hypothetical protein n=1 Tax=Actinoplanes sp. NPDC051494 TaxID=3363907 RepID=UPI0037BAFE29
MTDLRRTLDEIAGPAVEPSADQLTADITRGKRALRRRRGLQAAGGSVFAVAAVVAAVSFTAGGTATAPATTTALPEAKAPAVSTKTVLVAYQGKQPKGFTIDKVPDGFAVEVSRDSVLTLAPADAVAAPDPDGSVSYVGKISIFLQSKDEQAPTDGDKVKVGSGNGLLVRATGGGDQTVLWIEQPNGVWAQIMVWATIGLTDEQILDFGAGLHVEKDAVQGVG